MRGNRRFSFMNKSGWGGGIRTPECMDQNHVPYHLATPQRLRSIAKVCKRKTQAEGFLHTTLPLDPKLFSVYVAGL